MAVMVSLVKIVHSERQALRGDLRQSQAPLGGGRTESDSLQSLRGTGNKIAGGSVPSMGGI